MFKTRRKRPIVTDNMLRYVYEIKNKKSNPLEYLGEIRWDASKPDGQPRRCLDVSRAREEFGFEAEMGFREGVERTIEWYMENKNRR